MSRVWVDLLRKMVHEQRVCKSRNGFLTNLDDCYSLSIQLNEAKNYQATQETYVDADGKESAEAKRQ